MRSAWEFAEDVTVTQLSHAAKARRFVLTFFWMFLCLVGVILTIIQTVQLLQILLSYPKDTNVLVNYRNYHNNDGRMQFPAVTICSNNPYDRSALGNLSKTHGNGYWDSTWSLIGTLRNQQTAKNEIDTPLYQSRNKKKRETGESETECISMCDNGERMIRQVISKVMWEIREASNDLNDDLYIPQCCINESESDLKEKVTSSKDVWKASYIPRILPPVLRKKRGGPVTVISDDCMCKNEATSYRFIRQVYWTIREFITRKKRDCCDGLPDPSPPPVLPADTTDLSVYLNPTTKSAKATLLTTQYKSTTTTKRSFTSTLSLSSTTTGTAAKSKTAQGKVSPSVSANTGIATTIITTTKKTTMKIPKISLPAVLTIPSIKKSYLTLPSGAIPSDILNKLTNSNISSDAIQNISLINQSIPIPPNVLNQTLNGTITPGPLPNPKTYPRYVYIFDKILNSNATLSDMLDKYLPNISSYLPDGINITDVLNIVTEMPLESFLTDMKNDSDKIVEFNEINKMTFGIPNNLSDQLFAETCVKQIAPFILAIIPERKLTQMAYQYSTLFSSCIFEGRTCDEKKDFFPTFDHVSGNCWTFNHKNATNSDHAIYQSGKHHGLSLGLTVSQNLFMPMAHDAGVKVIISNQDDSLFTDTEFFVVPIGFTTDFSISMISVNRLPQPYGNCVDEPGLDYLYDGKYSVEGCIRSCYQKGIYETCGCYDPSSPVPVKNDSENLLCTSSLNDTNEYDCVKEFSDNKALFVSKCNCPPPCIETYYKMSKSVAPRPRRVLRHYEYSEIKEPNVIVNVFFRTLTYVVFEEYPSYTIVNFLSDLGGNFGNWLGFSFITCFEMAFLFALIITARNRLDNLTSN